MDKLKFKLTCIDKENRISKLEMLINDVNILEWKDSNIVYTTQYNLDEIIEYLTLDTIEFANSDEDYIFDDSTDNILESEKLCYSKEFENEDDETNYFEYIHDYFYRHSIGHASGGAIIANIYFRKKGDLMEIAWDNQQEEQNFTSKFGVAYIDIKDYLESIWELKVKYDKIFNK